MEKLDYLIKTLNSEIEIPETEQEKKDLFRSLMNTWKVSKLPSEFYEVQDEYLQEILNAKGITRLEDLTEIDENIYLWQGDITTLKVDAIVNAANKALLGCLIIALENNLKSIAFCCISTGQFRFPNDLAAEIAVTEVRKFLRENPTADLKVVFNVFKDLDKKLYEELLG